MHAISIDRLLDSFMEAELLFLPTKCPDSALHCHTVSCLTRTSSSESRDFLLLEVFQCEVNYSMPRPQEALLQFFSFVIEKI